MIDRHVGRESPTFVVEGNPDTFINLINRHGILCRVMRARKCPCVTSSGSASMYCSLCRGDGHVYSFQRKLLQADEDSDVRGDGSEVAPLRYPVLEPVRVERLMPPEQGGIVRYNIEGFDADRILISGTSLPKPWMRMRVSYYFDRYLHASDDRVLVDANSRTLTATMTEYNDGHRSGNVMNAHGDIALLGTVRNSVTGYVYERCTFVKNRIYVDPSEPEPVAGEILADYYYAPPTRVLVSDLTHEKIKTEPWTSQLVSGSTRMSLEPWYELSSGDIITLLTTEYIRDEVLMHGASGTDRLTEFDVGHVDDEILGEDGRKYRVGDDFRLERFRDLVWTGERRPQPGTKISVKYGYHPTYVIFQDSPQPNNLENKFYPTVVDARLWSRVIQKDIEREANPVYELPGMPGLQ